MTRPYRFHYLFYCKTCECYQKKLERHKGHDLWFSKDYKESALQQLMMNTAIAYAIMAGLFK